MGTDIKLNVDDYVKAGILTKKGSWYSFGDKNIGQKEKATTGLLSLIKEGKLDHIKTIEPITTEKKPTGLKPVKSNKNLENTEELPQNLEDFFKPLASKIGDIEARKKGGRFLIFIFGIDSRKADSKKYSNDSARNCPYVFRHKDKKSNVRSGMVTYNDGWTVLSKKNIEVDTRTGKKWLEVARDDTPDEDMFSVSNYVLCYALKKQFLNKHGKRNMEDMLKTTAVTDARQENAENMAKVSKTDPEKSLEGFMTDNKASQAIAKETLEKNENYTSEEAKNYVDGINSIGSTGDIAKDVANMKALTDKGLIGKTVKNSTPLKITDV